MSVVRQVNRFQALFRQWTLALDNSSAPRDYRQMSDSVPEKPDAVFRRHWWGYGMSMVILYAFSGPLLRYIPAVDLHVLGLFIGGIVFAGYWASIYRGDWDAKVMSLIALALLIITGIVASPKMNTAIKDDNANDRRCLAIQSDMLSPTPLRSDDPDLFQALGCRLQGEGSVFAPPPLKKEITHGVIPPAKSN